MGGLAAILWGGWVAVTISADNSTSIEDAPTPFSAEFTDDTSIKRAGEKRRESTWRCTENACAMPADFLLDIPALPLWQAVEQFSVQTQLQVSYFSPGSTALSNPVRGRYTAESALQALLPKTGYGYTRIDPRTYSVMAISRVGDAAEYCGPYRREGSPDTLDVNSADPDLDRGINGYHCFWPKQAL